MSQSAPRIDPMGDSAQDLVGVPVPTSLIEYEQFPDTDGEGGRLVAAFLKIPQLADRTVN